MATVLDSCQACTCHVLGVLLTVVSFALLALGVACVAIFDEKESWYELGLGAFGVSGFLAILLVVYACFVMSKSWKLFGCCGVWTSDKGLRLRGRLEETNPYEMHVNPRPISTANTANVIGMV